MLTVVEVGPLSIVAFHRELDTLVLIPVLFSEPLLLFSDVAATVLLFAILL